MDKITNEEFMIPENLDNNNSSFIYGEMNYHDIAGILNNINGVDRIILDIGSGSGRLICNLANMYNMTVDGVEIAENRYLKSLELIEKMEIFDKVFVYNTDFRKVHLSNYDILICCNLVFSKKDNIDLYHKILDEFSGYCILNTYDYNLKKFLYKTEYVRTSWNEKQLVYIFLIR